MLWLMDWLIQEAAKDLVNTDEEGATGEERSEEEDDGGVGEEGGAACMEEDLPEEDGVGEKQGRALETLLREVS